MKQLIILALVVAGAYTVYKYYFANKAETEVAGEGIGDRHRQMIKSQVLRTCGDEKCRSVDNINTLWEWVL